MKTKTIDTREELPEVLQHRRRVLIAYLNEKLNDQDWHGVQDAASDIREIDAKLSMLS